MAEKNINWKKIDILKLSPALIIAGIIIFFSSLPSPLPPIPREDFILNLDINTILHFSEFAGLAFLVAFGFFDKVKLPILIGLTVLFAFLDEVHQYFVPNRFYDIYDLIVDSIGVLLGFLAYIILIKLKKRFNKKKNEILNNSK